MALFELISIHALCEEGDVQIGVILTDFLRFLSTPSARRATYIKRLYRWCDRFLSTPSARRATKSQCALHSPPSISIHALCEEGDRAVGDNRSTRPNFYPRPLRGGRHGVLLTELVEIEFLSTPSARRATEVCGADRRVCEISIHALCEEGDTL